MTPPQTFKTEIKKKGAKGKEKKKEGRKREKKRVPSFSHDISIIGEGGGDFFVAIWAII